ncbi:MAG: hypothetical protein ABIR92_04960, partial [Gemmatimonadaceae bacterium]
FRALLGADGRTVLEATTGSLDGTAPVGNIDKVQLKLPKSTGRPSTQNFNNLTASGYWTYTLPAPAPTGAIDIQAHIGDIDKKKTDVVSATTTVSRRPDIAVNAVHAPPAVLAGMPYTITADIAELNGDVGARFNCVLLVNGTVVDQANGLWVDAGDVVSCMFEHTLSGQGSNVITVSATGVTPGDWSTANNSASTTVVVPGPGLEFNSGFLQVYQFDVTGRVSTDRSAPLPYHSSNDEILKYSTIYMSAAASGASAQDAVGTLLASIQVDGTEVGSFILPLTGRTQTSDLITVEECASYNDMGRWASICTQTLIADPTVKTTSANFQHTAGTITYYGQEKFCEELALCDAYTWNESYAYSGGLLYNFQAGETIGVSLTFVGSSGASQSLNKSVVLLDRSAEINANDSLCGTDATLGFNFCYENHRSGTWLYGQLVW